MLAVQSNNIKYLLNMNKNMHQKQMRETPSTSYITWKNPLLHRDEEKQGPCKEHAISSYGETGSYLLSI